MNNSGLSFSWIVAWVMLFRLVGEPVVATDERPQREFTFSYGATIDGLTEGGKVRIWIPIAQNNRFQKVEITKLTFPAEAKVRQEQKYGNRMFFLETTYVGSGRMAFEIEYEVVRKEAAATGKLDENELKVLDQFLLPNQLVPVAGKPIETLEKFLKEQSLEIPAAPWEAGRILYDFVEDHMKYDKSKPGYGTGNSNWACDSRTGNCTDFHSLFISVARANQVPAQFRIGFPLPAKRGQGSIGGYHCWAFFYADEKGWNPVDISEADKDPEKKDYFFGNLTENRIQFSTGRDLILEPPQSGPPLNYFVYPYVEVDGKPLPKENIKPEFHYRDRVVPETSAGQ